ncbi:glycosyltransferase [Helicobacter mustelae]|uniref:Cholesterol alpha-glucosyltransferase n=2 Tax=Helicobacter mustelae TaxID=217 RepID=D3UHL7_HELM1|nr:glycosyltransferase [Helicobacter mustelae]ABI95890.1 cholesterol alpha-glucosyltransferase [Helicobacter mustelae]CBG39989.1 Cholesterol alpha-glucosyltransferase [Helicobacter mustelae 12198]SQH71501.1 cholesterol alpha-glucosyltransferase [Helicobacter mustelae]STP12627.1 cholesterol alpha-glucosyltransferase [Helicobacter mustelae]
MTIGIVIDSYNDRSNGTSMTAFRFAREFVKKGHEVRIVACNVSKSMSDEEDLKLYPVKQRYIPIVTEVSKKQHMIFGAPDLEVLQSAVVGCDIVHFYMPFALEIAGMHLCRSLRIPYISAFHVQPQHISYNMNMNFSWFNTYLFKRFYKHFYRYTHHIHCPSKFIEKELQRENYGGKKYTISNGFFGGDRVMADPYEDSFFHIASVGRFSKEKKQDIIIKAIAKNPYADKIKLHLHGVGPREKYLKNLCNKLLINKPEFGFIDNGALLEKLAKMHLYVHAAKVESEAISCLEAISLGVVPVIADSETSATVQFALDPLSLFEVNNVADLSNKITYWIEHPKELLAYKQKYAESALQYSLDKSIEETLGLYEEAIRDFRDQPALFDRINA